MGKDSCPEFKSFEAINQFDMDIINNIGERLNCQDEYGYCMIMPEDELAIAEGCQVSEDEIAMYDQYRKAIYEEVENMLPGKICAYGCIIRANRICRLLSMHAQDDVIQNEAVLFAQALVLCEYCESMKVIELTV